VSDQKKPALISRPFVAMQATMTRARPHITAIALMKRLLAGAGTASAEMFATRSIFRPIWFLR
jgi:hypothetical protein